MVDRRLRGQGHVGHEPCSADRPRCTLHRWTLGHRVSQAAHLSASCPTGHPAASRVGGHHRRLQGENVRISRLTKALAVGLLTVSLAGLSACGAGSRTGAQTAATVPCDFENPAQPTTVNVLAYNSSAVDPFTNTMVKNCTRDNVTVKHDPIDFGGQVQKTVATLSGDKGSYDVIETYGYIIPTYAAQGSLQPLDDLYAKYKDKYKLEDINEDMRKAMSYDGKLYGLPMQAQVLVLAYRKDVFDKLGLEPPTTFQQLRDVSKKIQDAGEIKYPLALPWLANADIVTGYG